MHNFNPKKTLTPAAEAVFKSFFGDRFQTGESVCLQHGRDESSYPICPPEAVIYAHSTEDVQRVVQLCNEHEVPLVPFGVGSSIEGHVLPIHGGISLDLSEMNQIIDISPEDFTVTVQAGVTRIELNQALREYGLFFPIDPGANATIGGMASTRASGTNAVRYGTMSQNILSMQVVTAQGKVIRTSSHAKKSSSGYDLTRLYIGSEGTLGVITELTLRLYPIPESMSVCVCHFPTLQDAVNCVTMVMQSGGDVSRVEFIDENGVRAVNAYSQLNLQETPVLLFEFAGSPSSVKEQIELVSELAKECGGYDFEWAEKTEDRNRLWKARHDLYFACLRQRTGSRGITTDVCVPISKLAECVQKIAEEMKNASFPWSILGHVGDGNFHVVMAIDPDSTAERDEAERYNQSVVNNAIVLGGTCTGEHGVGIHKMDFIKREHGEDAIEIMRAIKKALDPKNLMNPGKMFEL